MSLHTMSQNTFKFTFEWMEGNTPRSTQVEMPTDLTYPQMEEYFRQALKKAVKYSDSKVPEGLLMEGEAL